MSPSDMIGPTLLPSDTVQAFLRTSSNVVTEETVQRVEVRNPDFDQPLTVSETKSSFQPLSYVDLLAIKIDPVRRLVGEVVAAILSALSSRTKILMTNNANDLSKSGVLLKQVHCGDNHCDDKGGSRPNNSIVKMYLRATAG
ncbi:hypothetical protein CY34DRAFT_580993 [Suillus luteus UH-Slu-Lm8-n1]|uniref:Uncharacterized protein n=1 Tax=Suillus luteus UH-Slu-Lm8-n1 TaxID=930992 RepID=A0A0D0C1E7_9AGAM|nr:hypothetical protein CY34DRAFT_580993 [Suillus luteus UH-Slu-Lm8-n1]